MRASATITSRYMYRHRSKSANDAIRRDSMPRRGVVTSRISLVFRILDQLPATPELSIDTTQLPVCEAVERVVARWRQVVGHDAR